MKLVLLLSFVALLGSCSSSPSRPSPVTNKASARYDWYWTDGLSVEDFNSPSAKSGRKVSREGVQMPPDENPPKSKLAKAVFVERITYDQDTTYNGFLYKKGVTYAGLRTHTDGKNGKDPFVILPQYQEIKVLSIQAVYFKEHGASHYQVMNLDTGAVTASNIVEIRHYNHKFGNGTQFLSKIFLITDQDEAIFTYKGKPYGRAKNFDSELTEPFHIPALISIKDDWSNEQKNNDHMSIAIRHRENGKRYYQLYSQTGEPIGEPIDFSLVRHHWTSTIDEHKEHWEARSKMKYFQTIRLLVQVDKEQDLYMPVGPKGIVSHPKVAGLRPLTVDVRTVRPEQIKSHLPFDYIWARTAIKWRVNNEGLLGWGLYAHPISELDQLNRIQTVEGQKTVKYFKSYRPTTIDVVQEDQTVLTTKLSPLNTFIVDLLGPKTELTLMTPLYRLGDQQWPLEQYGSSFGSEKEFQAIMAKRNADISKQLAASEIKMKNLLAQRKLANEAARVKRQQEMANQQAYYNAITQNGPRATDLATYQYEVAIYCQANRNARCQQYKARAQNWQSSHNSAAAAANQQRIQNYMNNPSGGNSGWQGFSYTKQTTDSFNKTVREGKERQDLKEQEQLLNERLKQVGR